MRAIILAADSGAVVNQKLLPKCLLEVSGRTILERQVSALNGMGIDNIYVVIGRGAEPWNETNIGRVAAVGSFSVVYNDQFRTTLSPYSLFLALSKIQDDDILILDGDLVFDPHTIQLLIENHNGTVLLAVSDKLSNGFRIRLTEVPKEGYVVDKIGKEFLSEYVYSGIMKIDKPNLHHFKKLLANGSYDAQALAAIIDDIRTKMKIWCIKLVASKNGVGTYELASMAGGSFSRTRKLAVSNQRQIIRKEVVVKGEEKLIDEITWIQNLKEPVKRHFPEIIRYRLNREPTFYEMPCYNSSTLRTLLLNGEIQVEEAVKYLHQILDLLFNHVYPQDRRPAPENFVRQVHLKKIYLRLLETKQSAELFRDVIEKDTIVINNIEYPNIMTIVNRINHNTEFLKFVSPLHTCRTHGDLHFDNILIDRDTNNFILLDPRGNYEYDICYDLGKIWHSCHGLYDFIHTRRFELKIDHHHHHHHIQYEITDEKSLQNYHVILQSLPEILSRYDLLKEEGDWITKTLFAEAALFSSVIPFHLNMDGVEDVALLLYAKAVELINSVYDHVISRLSDQFIEGSHFMNIASEEDYIKAGKIFT